MSASSVTPSGFTEADLVADAETLAARWLAEAVRSRSWRENAQGRRITRLLENPDGFTFVLALTDEVMRIRTPRRAAAHLASLLEHAPPGLGRLDRVMLETGRRVAGALPAVVMPLVTARVRAELSGFVKSAEGRPLGRHIRRRRRHGIRLNINLLGEAVLGEDEAARRLEAVMALLDRPDVDYVSVKVSSICSQLNVAAFDHEVRRVAGRLRRLYDCAMTHSPAKFVNLDMEEYSDLDLTLAVFRQVLDEPRYGHLNAGIVLQAYLPDSHDALRSLVIWARDRHRRCGGTTKVRIVKGANLAMERVQSELAGWPQAPFTTKVEVDANYKRMLDVALQPENAGAIRVGVATHNPFEAAWALTLGRARGLTGMLEVEMLEGMAPSVAAAVRREAGDLLLYAPIARRADNESVIAYLVRRFDENSGPENFLRNQFSMRPGSADWEVERQRFRQAVAGRHAPVALTRRVQDRSAPCAPMIEATFANEADTDFALPCNRRWVSAQLRPIADLGIDVVPVVLAGRTVATGDLAPGYDPADPEVAAYQWVQADHSMVGEALLAARAAGGRWARTSTTRRRLLLLDVAACLSGGRGRLIGVMARDGGKTVAEADPEISEAIDFARYYAEAAVDIEALEAEGASFRPHGTIVVVPPWNFPLAIPAGGVLAALAAGNAVILKPAPETVATAFALAEACWEAGVPKDLLQFLPCADGDVSRRLITDPSVDGVILTGSWETARTFLGWRPTLHLHAETSGKNAIVVTAAADLDEAIADLVRSAFGHAGQKCSAASLGILEAAVYDDHRFLSQLADAVRSLRPGPGSDLRSTMGPLIRRPEGPLLDALQDLGAGETWLVEPGVVDGNLQLWSPGVKLGVRPGSTFHLTECFGPVLGLMRADNLDHAVALQNQPAYGLTAGLHSLDPAEIERWRDSVTAGNLYVNRHTTGAIVRRQPFGGWKRSVIGPGAKAGGPNYVAGLGTWSAPPAIDPETFGSSVASCAATDLVPVDQSGLVSEANVLRYVTIRRALVRAGSDVSDHDLASVAAAGGALGVRLVLSAAGMRNVPGVVVESERALCQRLGALRVDKVRMLGAAGEDLRLAAYDAGLWVDALPFVAHPRLEALRWVREQALSETRHRHGDLSRRRPGPIA